MHRPVLIVGATSSIARGAAMAFAAKGHSLYLAARDSEELARLAEDLRIRYSVAVKTGFFDTEETEGHAAFLQRVDGEMGGLEGVVLSSGYSGNHQEAMSNYQEAMHILTGNLVCPVCFLTHVAALLEKRRGGFLAVLTAAIADRGSQSNYVYASAKGGLTIFLQGLRSRLYGSKVHVVTVKLGAVDTATNFGRGNKFLVASPQYVGKKIVEAVVLRRNEVYIPWMWWSIMKMIKLIPESVYKRMKL